MDCINKIDAFREATFRHGLVAEKSSSPLEYTIVTLMREIETKQELKNAIYVLCEMARQNRKT